MSGRDRTAIPKGSHLLIAVHDRGFSLLGNNFAENTGICHIRSDPGEVGMEMDCKRFEHR
jgi:hypothetical protein